MSDMRTWVAEFEKQLTDAENISRNAGLKPVTEPVQNVIISGLGGSGIGGTIVSELAKLHSPVPVTVNKDYFCPAFVGPHTLFIASSYSGNTEETLQCTEEAFRKGARVVVITSGGRLQQIAAEKDFDCIVVPGGYHPRACLGYSLFQLLGIFIHYRLLPPVFEEYRSGLAAFIRENGPAMQAKGQELALFLKDSIPVLYAESHLEGVTIRLRQQINENAKMLCWHHVIPEMNHNELVGWRNTNNNLAVVFITDPDGYYRNRERTQYCINVVKKYTQRYTELSASGSNPLQKVFSLIHTGDWASIYLSELNGVDAMEIDVIHTLKSTLADLK